MLLSHAESVQCSVECSTKVESHSAVYGAAFSAVLRADSSAVSAVPVLRVLSAVLVLSAVQCTCSTLSSTECRWC